MAYRRQTLHDTEMRQLPRIDAKGLNASPAPYTVQELIDLGNLDRRDWASAPSASRLSRIWRGASANQWGFFYMARDNNLTCTGRLVWGKGSAHSIRDAMELAAGSGEQRSAASEAQHWLEDYLTMNGGVAESAKIKKAAHAARHTSDRCVPHGRLKVEISERRYALA